MGDGNPTVEDLMRQIEEMRLQQEATEATRLEAERRVAEAERLRVASEAD